MTYPHSTFPALVHRDCSILVFGGSSHQTACESLDVGKQRWSALPDMPTARWGHAAAMLDGDVAAIMGGCTGAAALSSVLLFDIDPRTWREASWELPVAMSSFSLHVVDASHLIIAGGSRGSEMLTAVHLLSLPEAEWTAMSALPFPADFAAFV